MQADGWKVSLLYRRHVREEQQSPRTAELAARLGVVGDVTEHVDGGCLHAPPALYRFDGRFRHIARIAQQGWFDLVLCSVWFWNEPSPAFAEIALPLIRSHSPQHRQPYVGLLIDDAHAIRAKRLAVWESDPIVRREYEQQATSLEPRLRSIYSLADMILHVSASDQAAERSSDFASTITPALNWQLLRTPLKTMRSTSTVIRRRASPPTAVRIGFLGNGQTATNHQGVQWFLIHCWAALRQRFPKIRLRLVGRKPGVVYNSSGVYECKHGAGSSRCGWAWGTPFEGREKENGIDELSFLNQEGMLYEAMSWRGMVAPIRATTGINTKLLVSLELGVPLMVTTAAAAPLNLGLYSNRSTGAALLADEPTEFIAACSKLLSSDHAWRTHSKAALEAYQRMEAEDPAASDMRKLLSAACDGGHGGRWAAMMEQQQAHPTPQQTSSSLSVDASIFDSLPSLDKLCEVVDDVAQGCEAG